MQLLNKLFWIGIVCLFTVWSGFADVATMFVPKAVKPPELDGQIKDGEWAAGAKSGKFMILADPTNAATEQTQAFIMRDDENLYIAFRCHESQVNKIKATIKTRNDAVYLDDDVEFFICNGENPANYHQFTVNSIGTQWDDSNGKENDWKAKSFVGSNLWSAEMVIPFACLGIKAEEGMIFRGNFCRGQKPKGENSAWPTIGSGSFNDLQNSARIVIGSYKAVAMREIEGLIKKAEGLPTPESLAGEKAGILDEVRKLAEGIKARDKLTLQELRESGKKTAGLEDRKVALEAKTVQERFGSATVSNRIYLISEPSRSGYDLPEVWATRQILGKDFWFDILHQPDTWKKAGLQNEPFIKDSLMRFQLGGWYQFTAGEGERIFEYKFFDPRSEICQTLKETNRPFVIAGHFLSGPVGIAPSVCRRFLKEYGTRFAGFTADECYGHNPGRDRKNMGLPPARNRYDAFLGFVAAYFDSTVCKNKNNLPILHSWALLNPAFRPWTSAATATYLDHWILELGAPYSGQEIGGDYAKHLGMCFGFSRGAARQYEKPWRVYVAVYRHGVAGGDSELDYRGFLSPECRRFYQPCNDKGPYSGTPLSLQRRQLYAAYMSGVNMIRDESDHLLFVANYDYRNIDKIDPLVKVTRDKPYCLSPAGEIRKELYDNIVKKHDRGTAYTPTALIFDRHHGFIPTYYRSKVLGVLPFTEGDYMMLAVESALFPLLSQDPDADSLGTGPYGDMFDVLTNNARQETLKAYRTLLLVGDVDLDKLFVERLMNYVRDGGTLIINAKQVKEGALSDAFLGCKILKERGEGRIGYSLLDGAVITERKSFGYQRLEPKTAIPLILCADADGEKDVLMTANKYGQGIVIMTAPDYMYEAGSKNRMLNMFSYLMSHLRDELLPIKWKGEVELLVNRNSKGWVITLINNEGVTKKGGQKEVIDNAKKADIWLRLEKQAGGLQVKEITEWVKGEKLGMSKTKEGAETQIAIPPGDIRILEFRMD